jgi:hypothetical protein
VNASQLFVACAARLHALKRASLEGTPCRNKSLGSFRVVPLACVLIETRIVHN